MDANITLNSSHIPYWFNALRNLPEAERTRAFDAFWSGQIDSKAWLVECLNEFSPSGGNIYIFGGWIGLLGNFLLQSATWSVDKVRSIDINPWCETVADAVNQPYVEDEWRFKAITADMCEFNYDWSIPPDIVINTSTEHVDQNTYDRWWDKIPPGTTVVLQGNDYFSCPEHIRCSSSLADFKRMNHTIKTVWEGSLPTSMYNRWMTISIK